MDQLRCEKMKHSAEFEAFDNLVGKLMTVSREEINQREAEYRKRSDANPRKRGPKKKVKPSASDHGEAAH